MQIEKGSREAPFFNRLFGEEKQGGPRSWRKGSRERYGRVFQGILAASRVSGYRWPL